ncbi:hypothetical protein IH992_32425, partial [Candidatus Poribacteria bacterium]|nr:hypothetical protein [Candidatus Poribacteria bacterium]
FLLRIVKAMAKISEEDWEDIQQRLLNVTQGKGLEWVIQVVHELGGEVIVRSKDKEDRHFYGPGTRVAERIIPDRIRETGCELTLAFPLFRN